MTTLIVGCGYLGLRVARLLRDRDPHAVVYGTTRSPGRFAEIEAAGATPILADVLSEGGLDALPPADRIVHCVAYKRGGPVSSRDLYVTGMARFLARVQRGRLVHVSTTSVYGQMDGSWVDEDSPTEPTTEAGRVAIEAESLVSQARKRGLEATSIRLAGLYGPGRVIGRAAILAGEAIPGDPQRWLNLIRIEDASAVVVAALLAERPGPLSVASDDRPVRRSEYYGRLAALLGAPEPSFSGGAGGEPDKRIRNRRMKAELGVVLQFPDIEVGLPGLIV